MLRADLMVTSWIVTQAKRFVALLVPKFVDKLGTKMVAPKVEKKAYCTMKSRDSKMEKVEILDWRMGGWMEGNLVAWMVQLWAEVTYMLQVVLLVVHLANLLV